MNITFVPWFFVTDNPSEDFVRMGLRMDVMDVGVRYKGFLLNSLEVHALQGLRGSSINTAHRHNKKLQSTCCKTM